MLYYECQVALWLPHAAKPHLDANEDEGSFLYVASIAGVVSSGSFMAYSVTKAAQIHLLNCLATICGPTIQCNSVSLDLLITG